MPPKSQRMTRCPPRRGFTLIELLVVIAIISMLISILLPALSGARAQGQRVRCVANMREIAQTAHNYANDDPRSTFGPVHPKHEQFTGEGYADYGGGPGIAPYTGWGDDFDPRTRPFNRIIYSATDLVPNTTPGDRGSFEVYQCGGEEYGWQNWPGFDALPEELERSYYTANGTAFRMNNLAWDDGFIGGVYMRPISRIPDTGATVGFMEARAFQTLWTNEVWGQSSEHGELTGYHRSLGYFCLAYADGHGSFADMGDGTYFPRTPRFDYRDVRGSWGRMDCLPDALYAD